MGNCAPSRLVAGAGDGEDDDPVALCRERKRLLEAAVERRRALAAAHAAYFHSLKAVAAAIDVFVSRHSAPVLAILPPVAGGEESELKVAPLALHCSPCPSSSSPALVCDPESEAKVAPLADRLSPCTSSSSDSSSDDEDERDCLFTGEDAKATPEAFVWDFFNPFEPNAEEVRVARDAEGIPELEETGEEVSGQNSPENAVKVAPLSCEAKQESSGMEMEECKDEKGLIVVGERRELLQALRDVEDQFIRAFDSGKELSRMLEVPRFQFQPGIEDIKENLSKKVQAITWHRSPSTSSSKSQLTSSCVSKSCSESNSDNFYDYGGMASGSHSQTLGRLYAWEKKLYEEVKAGDRSHQLYERKCMQLRNQEAKGPDSCSAEKTRTSVRDLHTRIWVTLRSVESISQRIQKLRDEELQPQIIELLQGLTRSWKIMLESHETQKQIMFEVDTFTCPAYGKYSNETQRLATDLLAAEFRNWRICFASYISAQKAYVEALDGWLSKFLLPDVPFHTLVGSSLPSDKVETPPIVFLCHEWFTLLEKLPDMPVSVGIRNFTRTVRFLCAKQGEEMQRKRKVDILAKELSRRVTAFEKEESKAMDSKLSETNTETDAQQNVEHLSGKKEILDIFRKKLDAEKAKHHDCVQESQEIMLNGFKIGLASIFESLARFSKDSLNLYSELLTLVKRQCLSV